MHIRKPQQRRLFEGWAATTRACRDKVSYSPRGAIATLPIPLLLEHKAEQIGLVQLAKVSTYGIYVGCELFSHLPNSDAIWSQVRSGAMCGLSVGSGNGAVEERFPSGLVVLKKWRWLELSLVKRPKNPDARICLAAETYGWS